MRRRRNPPRRQNHDRVTAAQASHPLADPKRLRIQPRHHVPAVDLGRRHNVGIQPQGEEILSPQALAQSLGQPLRRQGLRAQGLRQGKSAEPGLTGRQCLRVLLIDHSRLTLEPIDQQAGQQDVVVADEPIGAGAKNGDVLAIQQLGDDGRRVDERCHEHQVGLPRVDHGAGAVRGGKDDRFSSTRSAEYSSGELPS